MKAFTDVKIPVNFTHKVKFVLGGVKTLWEKEKKCWLLCFSCLGCKKFMWKSINPFFTQSRILMTLRNKVYENNVGKVEYAGHLNFPSEFLIFWSHLFFWLYML